MAKSKIDFLTIREMLDYNPETGIFMWISGQTGRSTTKPAGNLHTTGYLRIIINGKPYLAHRLAWLWMTGEWPIEDIDHKNGIKSNNSWVNLREATRTLNRENQRHASKNNKTGFLGVIYKKRYRLKPYVAQIQIAKKLKHIGNYTTPEEAHSAYLAVKRRLHKGCTL